jgi:phosphate transport system permease protein
MTTIPATPETIAHTVPAELARLPRRRRWVNEVTRWVVGLGGAAVIGAIALIFFYLVWVVAPIVAGASIDNGESHTLPAGKPLLIDANETGEVGLHIAGNGIGTFFELTKSDGNSELAHTAVVDSVDFGVGLRSVKHTYPHNALYSVLNDAGAMAFFEATYPVSFESGERHIGAELRPLFSEDWVEIGEVDDFDTYYEDFEAIVTTLTGSRLQVYQFRDAEPGYPLERPRSGTVDLTEAYERVIMGPRGKWAYLIGANGGVALFDLGRATAPREVFSGKLVADGAALTALEPLLGRYSLLVADNTNHVAQWIKVRTEYGYRMEKIREFKLDAPAVRIVPEPRRKGFAAIDADNQLHLIYSTSERVLDSHPLGHVDFELTNISPRSNLLLTAGAEGVINTYHLENEHPEISWSALWSKVWYEGYGEPVYSWQSSSADNDFEPKFSLTPLLFGTLKAAFYAMVFAVPLAIMGAIYSAYFMAPAMRRVVKPGIEIMAALPTVILGFLAGLWLAPRLEEHLAAFLCAFFTLPVGILVTAAVWARIPDELTARFNGWYGLLILPVIVAAVAGALELGPVVETAWFGGDIRAWLLDTLGLAYDQRNALVVGLAMGLAVIPAIFSLAEDAIYGVPTHLKNGSLALGATHWQTLVRVVILTASPGIFSAVMIGLGRAVGETMIVLMATGNTPIMDSNLFEGMRTFAANIAVELPESEVDSTHYRILFLTALVLFLITFVFNTAAEVVRQRLRARYGSL